jgi:hypothetical protein
MKRGREDARWQLDDAGATQLARRPRQQTWPACSNIEGC